MKWFFKGDEKNIADKKDFNKLISQVCNLVYDATPDIDIEYVLHHLHSDGFIHYAVSLGFGTKMPRISHKIVSEYKIYVPTLEKQKDILRNLAQLTEIKKQLQNSIELTRAMRNAILTQVIT